MISRHEIDYLCPIVCHPEPPRLELWIERIGGARFTVRYEVYDGAHLAALASTLCVSFDFESDRPRRLAEEGRDLLVGFAGTTGAANE